MTDILNNIRVVLDHTSHAGNIGATARAMKNMGLRQLVLVEPKLFPHGEATARAAGADNLLASAQVVSTLDEALQDCIFVVGASARKRNLSSEIIDVRAAANQVLNHAQSGQVAIVFGNEQNGLSNEQLQRCHCQLVIPTEAEYSSLNLAAAVQVVVHEIRMTLLVSSDQLTEKQTPYGPLATADELQGMYQHLNETLITIDFLDQRKPGRIMGRLKRLFNRARLSQEEVNIMRGILKNVIDSKTSGDS